MEKSSKKMTHLSQQKKEDMPFKGTRRKMKKGIAASTRPKSVITI